MFKRSGQDNIHHANIKRAITSHFARMLKILQQKHIQQSDGDEFVYSNDESNNLCNALEAVFLHGLKPPVTQKLSSYVGWAAPEDTSMSLNFWAVAEKFTHKDVILHLKSLRQITSDTGLCRAWIRLALNDGLMESYLHSIVVDVKSLKYFYHSYSYLRDIEQPGILKNYLTGLMSLAFNLSLNSSVLNDWNNSTLQLISNLGSAPAAVIRQVDSGPRTHDSSPPKVLHREDKRRKPSSTDDGEPIIARKSSSRTSSQIGGEVRAMFSCIADVEAIRKMAPAPSDSQVSYTPSDCSSSSHTSCPDPSMRPLLGSPAPDLIGSPHLHPRPSELAEQEVKAFGAEKLTETPAVAVPFASTAADSEDDFVSQLALSPPRQRSRRVTELDAQYVSPAGSVSSSISSLGLRESRGNGQPAQGSHASSIPSQESRVNLSRTPVRENASSQNHKLPKAESASALTEQRPEITNQWAAGLPGSQADTEPCDDIYSSREKSPTLTAAGEEKSVKEKAVDDICAGLPVVKLDPSVQDAILRKVLGEIDRQADRDREARDLAHSLRGTSYQDQMETHEEAAVPTVTRPVSSPRSKSPAPTESTEKGSAHFEIQAAKDVLDSHRKSIVDDLSFERSTDTITNENTSAFASGSWSVGSDGNSQEQSGDAVNHISVAATLVAGEANEEDGGSGRFGNSLSSMSGWSSELDPKQQVKQTAKEECMKSESFAAMLRSYIPGGLMQEAAVTVDQVIRNLPGVEGPNQPETVTADGEDGPDGSSRPRDGSSSKTSLSDHKQQQDSYLDEYEILQSPAESLCGQVEANSSRMIFLFRVPQEHGLSHQNFTCRGCSRPIGIIYGQPRKCAFDGGLYCYECHENMETYIPSSIVFDWDFRKKKVCTENYRFLTELESHALYDIQELNPKLYTHLPELQDLKILRERLCYLKSYLFTCSQKMAESLRQKVWPREHLYDRRDLYSVTDLQQVQAGTLQRLIKDLVKFCSQHVYSCVLCSQKGYVCEICRSSRIIYPFEVDTTIRCERCKAVYHKTCMTESLPCPKCERWGRRTSSSIIHDHPEDYGISPDQISRVSQQLSPSPSPSPGSL